MFMPQSAFRPMMGKMPSAGPSSSWGEGHCNVDRGTLREIALIGLDEAREFVSAGDLRPSLPLTCTRVCPECWILR